MSTDQIIEHAKHLEGVVKKQKAELERCAAIIKHLNDALDQIADGPMTASNVVARRALHAVNGIFNA